MPDSKNEEKKQLGLSPDMPGDVRAKHMIEGAGNKIRAKEEKLSRQGEDMGNTLLLGKLAIVGLGDYFRKYPKPPTKKDGEMVRSDWVPHDESYIPLRDNLLAALKVVEAVSPESFVTKKNATPAAALQTEIERLQQEGEAWRAATKERKPTPKRIVREQPAEMVAEELYTLQGGPEKSGHGRRANTIPKSR